MDSPDPIPSIDTHTMQTTDAKLEDHFKDYGEVVWCQVVKDRNTNHSKG